MTITTPIRNRPNEALTVPEILAELKISRSTFYDWRAKRKAPRSFRLPNGEIRIKRAELDRWIESLEEDE
jgi:predicted DNA-binding transcriptional regulator AlpA